VLDLKLDRTIFVIIETYKHEIITKM
jgi:hypothetical protein